MKKEIIEFLLRFPDFKYDQGNLYQNNEIYFASELDFVNVANPLKYQKQFATETKYDVLISTNNASPEHSVIVNSLYYDNPLNIVVAGTNHFPCLGSLGVTSVPEFCQLAAESKIVLCFDNIECNSLVYNGILATTKPNEIKTLLELSSSERDTHILNIKKNLITHDKFRNFNKQTGV